MLGKVIVFSIVVATVVAQDQCPLTTYCGFQCCLSGVQRCCATSSNPNVNLETCCTADETNVERTCGSVTCPNSLPQSQVYDTNVSPAELRNQCCLYFREGCCSQSENNYLDLLLPPTLSLSLVVVGVACLFVFLLVTCCCCGCLSRPDYCSSR